MNYRSMTVRLALTSVLCGSTLAAMAQETSNVTSTGAPSANGTVVPQLVNYGGVLTDVNEKPLSGVVGVTFTLYQEESGGTPLWMEIQNVQLSKGGHYSVMLGSTTSTGLPQDVFVTGQARWLEVKAEGQPEQPRVLLVAVPYALKAADAETIGGLPASAFVLANGSQASAAKASNAATSQASSKASKPPTNPDVTGVGTVD
jgi:hypothetical protein